LPRGQGAPPSFGRPPNQLLSCVQSLSRSRRLRASTTGRGGGPAEGRLWGEGRDGAGGLVAGFRAYASIRLRKRARRASSAAAGAIVWVGARPNSFRNKSIRCHLDDVAAAVPRTLVLRARIPELCFRKMITRPNVHYVQSRSFVRRYANVSFRGRTECHLRV
jgi:hypothetical protein